MPLIKSKSKEAFKKNVATEMEANPGKENKAQNLAIAYSTQRHARKKKMALGGAVESETHTDSPDRTPMTPMKKPDDSRRPKDAYMGQKWAGEPELDDASDTSMRPSKDEYDGKDMAPRLAKGGEVGNPSLSQSKMGEEDMHPMDLMSDDERANSIADAILAKRKRMAEGGEVDLEEHSEEHKNLEDDLSFEANGKEQYDDSQISKQPMDSNEHGDSREDDSENKHDMISQIRMKMKAKRGA